MSLTSQAFGLKSVVPPRVCYNLGIGEPLLSPFPKNILAKLNDISGIHRYYPACGDFELRKMLLAKYYSGVGIEHLAITNGAIGALDFIFRSEAENGAQILIPNPGFPPYVKLAQFSQFKIVHYSIGNEKSNHLIDWDSIDNVVNEKTKLILINSPHNPTGKIFSSDDYEKLVLLLKKYPKLNFIMDEVYREIIFDNNQHMELANLINRGYIVGSFSKMYPLQGARIGWVFSDASKLKAMEPYFENAYGAVSSYGQELAKNILKDNYDYNAIYQSAKDLAVMQLKLEGVEFIEPHGAFYCFIDFKIDSERVTNILQNEGVTVIPGHVFGTNGKNYVRISFAQDLMIVRASIEIIGKVWRSLNMDKDHAFKTIH